MFERERGWARSLVIWFSRIFSIRTALGILLRRGNVPDTDATRAFPRGPAVCPADGQGTSVGSRVDSIARRGSEIDEKYIRCLVHVGAGTGAFAGQAQNWCETTQESGK